MRNQVVIQLKHTT